MKSVDSFDNTRAVPGAVSVKILWILSFLTLFFLCFASVGLTDQHTDPVTNEGKKWRIGYLQGGDYQNYPPCLLRTIEALMQFGWLEYAKIPEQVGSNKTDYIWKWLSENVQSDYIEFVPDAYWNNDWDGSTRVTNKKLILSRLTDLQDLDMMLAMGTWAGQDLANELHSVDTMVMSTSNPLQSKIIISAEDSGRDHIHAAIEPDRYRNQVALFHDIFKFQILGLVYENSLPGQTDAALADVEDIAEERGFSVITCQAANSKEEGIAAQNVIACHRKLASTVDALYITQHQGIDIKYMAELMAPMLAKKIPTWSQRGGVEVEHGVLMSFSKTNFVDAGLFYGRVMAQILRGTDPGNISQIYRTPSESIDFNLKTAQLINYNPGWDVLAAADHIYEKIKIYKKKR